MPEIDPARHLRSTDIRGIAKLASQATTGVTRIVEGVHQSIWDTLGIAGGNEPGQTGGLTGWVYRCVYNATQLLGNGVDTVLAALQPLLEPLDHAGQATPQREAVLAALNGILGDQLVASDNPLATPMTLRHQGQPLNWQQQLAIPGDQGKLLLLVHGLCMNDLQWRQRPAAQCVDYGETVQVELGYTPIYLRYNSGLHISQNGRELAALLEQLSNHWPTPIKELSVLAHSMGGLLIRSALHYAKAEGLHWPKQLQKIIFLGTPHHGAPLEQAGSWLDAVLRSTTYTAPLAKLAQLRSAGITDLRHGNVRDEDWQGQDRFERQPDQRQVVPLPEGVDCYAVAATTAAQGDARAGALPGDGLVPLRSALGQHHQAQRNLAFPPAFQKILYQTSHLQLLNSPELKRMIAQCILSPSI